MNKKKLFLEYTLLFALTALLVFVWYIITGRTFVWHVDGLPQHLNALIFYGEHLRNVLRTTLIEGEINTPSYSFSLGEGGDILTTLHYYAIGSPLCLLSVFFKSDKMYILYGIIVILRLYLSGLAFIYLCLTFEIQNETSILTGTISYVFSYFAIYNSARHYFFLLPLIFLPLIIACIEKAIRRERSIILVISVFTATISHFYFFFMIVLMAVIYTAIRLICVYGKNIKEYLFPLKTIFVYSFTGVLCAGFILVPVVNSFLSDERNNNTNAIHFLYPLKYYLDLPEVLLTPTNNYWLCLCFSPIAVLSILYLFTQRNRYKTLKIILMLCALFSLIPFFGQLFNGMGYMANRWCFAISLSASFTISLCLNEMSSNKAFFKTEALICTLMLAIVCIATSSICQNGVISQLTQLALLALALAFIPDKHLPIKHRPILILVCTVLSITISSFLLNMASEAPYVAEARRPVEIEEHMNDDGLIAQQLLSEETAFYRYSGHDLHYNSALNRGISSPNYYWTLTNPYCIRFNQALNLLYYDTHQYPDFDDRSILTNLASVLYYIAPEGYDVIPYGYQLMNNHSYPGYSIYINQEPLSISFSTSSVIRESAWLELSSAQREESLLYAAIVPDENNNNHFESSLQLSSQALSYDVEENEQGLILSFEGIANSETYITFEGLHFIGDEDTAIIIRSDSGVLKILEFYEDGYEYYNGRRDFTINLGYWQEPINSVDIIFADDGIYDYDSLSVECIPMDNTPAALQALSEDTLQNVVIGTDTVTGDIDLDEHKLLVFTIPYSEGWTAYVDGEEYPLINADIKYMGLDLMPGHHDIVLTYKTPYFGLGMAVSGLGIVMLLTVYILDAKSEKKRRLPL